MNKIDWQKIRKECPKSFLRMINWNSDSESIIIESLDDVVDTFEPYYFRELYDFFDQNGIMVVVFRNMLSSFFLSCEYQIDTYINGKYVGKSGSLGAHGKRIENEVLAFTEAFKILEKYIK